VRTALSDFQVSIGNVKAVAVDIRANAAAALASTAVVKRHETIQCGCVTILSGFLEVFIKDVAETLLARISGLGIPFNQLPSEIQETHLEKGGVILTKGGKRNLIWVTASKPDIALRLGSINNPTYTLLWEAFADTQGNPNADVIKSFMKSLGVRSSFDKLEQKFGRSANSIELELNAFIHVRNACAHSGIPPVVPAPSEIEGYCDFLDSLASHIVSVLEDHLLTSPFAVPSTLMTRTAPAPAATSGPVATTGSAPSGTP
jgi:hypothetical protein